MNYTIYPIPYEVRGLEYLNLLHRHLEESGSDGTVFRVKKFSWKLLITPYKRNVRSVVHIHWETNIYGSKYALVSFVRMLYRFPVLWLLKLRGVKIVWTMHNLYAHDYPHPKVDAFGRMLVRCLADTVIMQVRNLPASETAHYKNARTVYIPQGNYVGVYGDLWRGDRQALRSRHGIKPGEVILLALGSVRPYKALPELIRAVSEASALGAPVRLLIRGKASAEYSAAMQTIVKDALAVTLEIGFVKDAEIPEVFAMADYSVFYYGGSSLNSAAMILSLSYGTPVITRDIPAAEMIASGKNGFVFHGANDLRDILLSLCSAPHFDRNAIIETVSSQSWPIVTRRLKEVYKELWTHP